jgi:hypothetical protein
LAKRLQAQEQKPEMGSQKKDEKEICKKIFKRHGIISVIKPEQYFERTNLKNQEVRSWQN